MGTVRPDAYRFTMPSNRSIGQAGSLDALRSRPARSVARQLGIDSLYLLVGFPLALVSFILVVVGLAVGVANIITVVGLPIVAGTLFLARGFAHVERQRISAVVGTELAIPRYKRVPPGTGFWRRMATLLTDGQAWLDATHAFVTLPIAVVGFSIAFTWWVAALTGLAYPLYDWALPHTRDNYELHELLGFADTANVRMPFYVAIGVFFALTLYPIIRGLALFQANLGRGMLSGVAELRERIAAAEEAREVARGQKDAAVSAEATALRRLERDIHDGPQQRLVRLAIDLGRAQQQFDSDPEAARATVAEALEQTRETLDELRALSRGIAPPILVDRGLTAAVTALAGRCTVPVELSAPDVGRLVPALETAAYFVVAEALTNVAKHSRAGTCRVTLERHPDALIVAIADDGQGGAHLAKGHGLTGLDDRVHAAGGTLLVDSPTGAGTTVVAHLPL
jgi:signal transduction histidine kinase